MLEKVRGFFIELTFYSHCDCLSICLRCLLCVASLDNRIRPYLPSSCRLQRLLSRSFGYDHRLPRRHETRTSGHLYTLPRPMETADCDEHRPAVHHSRGCSTLDSRKWMDFGIDRQYVCPSSREDLVYSPVSGIYRRCSSGSWHREATFSTARVLDVSPTVVNVCLGSL